MPFISRSRLADLESRTESYAEFAREARKVERAALDGTKRMAVELEQARRVNAAQAAELLDLKTRVTP